jgi:hypothetical protein
MFFVAMTKFKWKMTFYSPYRITNYLGKASKMVVVARVKFQQK